MTSTQNRPPAVAPLTGGTVVAFPYGSDRTPPFDQLTARLILDQHRRGVLPEPVLLALLAAATGLRP